MTKRLLATLLLLAAPAFAQLSAFNVGGRTIASQYALWQAYTVNTIGAGTNTVTLDRCYVAAGPTSGRQFVPYATNVALTFHDTNTETVVPSAVAVPANGATTCTITANFSFSHSQNTLVTSGDGGVGEAVNDTKQLGGLVTVDGSFTGTTNNITGLTQGASNVAIEDIRAGGFTIYTWNGTAYSGSPLGGAAGGTFSVVNQAFAASESFNDSGSSNFLYRLSLTGNVTSSSVSQSNNGQVLAFILTQDATGGRSVTWPASFANPCTLNQNPNATTVAEFTYDGTHWQALSCPNGASGIGPGNTPAISHQFFSAYNSGTGAFTQSQPAYSDLTGTPTLPANTPGSTHQWFSGYNSTTGAFTLGQPAFSDLSGVATGAQLPVPTASALGGVFMASACPTGQHVSGINLTTGALTCSQDSSTLPGGSPTQVQINNGGVLGGIANPTTPAGVNQALIAQPGGTPQFALDSYPPNVQTGNYTVAVTDRGAVIDTTDSANDTYTAPDPTASGFGLNFGYTVCNDGTGTITENRSGTSQFNFGGSLKTSVTIPPFWCAEHNSDNTNFYVHMFANFLGFPGTGAQTALTFNSTTGAIGTLSNIVTQTANFTAGNIPKAADANNLADGYPVLGTDTNVPTAASITNGLAVCGDANGGLSPCANGSGSGQTNYPVSYQTMVHPLGLSSTAATTVANTVSATTLLSSFEGRQDVPPGVMIPATFGVKTIKLRAFGSFASVTTPNLTITPLLGGVAFGSGFAFTSVPAGPVQWQVDFYFTVTGITTAQYGGCASYINAGAVTQVCISGQATGLNFAASQNIDLQATWSAASASNTITANEITAYPVHTL